MSIILTPGQLQNQAQFYRQIATLAQAGIGVMAALEHLERNPPSRFHRQQASRLLQSLERQLSLAEAFRSTSPAPPMFDTALIEASEQSGRIDQCFALLADFYETRARMAKQIISDLLYPAFLLHFAVFIFPFAAFFLSGDLGAYLKQTLSVLLPLYLAGFLVVYACQGRHGEAWRSLIEKIGRSIPVLGSARKNLALARLAAALEALVNAGVPIFRALDLAASASGSPALRREMHGWRPRLELGQTPAEIIQTSAEFPTLFAGLYASGETSGRLDQELRHLHQLYLEEGTRQMKNLCSWAPKIVYFVIMLVIAYKIVSFWLGYFGQLESFME